MIDLTDVTFFGSTFISELIRLEKARKAQNFGRATIVAPAKSVVRRLFEVVGLTPSSTIVESYNDDPNSIGEFAPSGNDVNDRSRTLDTYTLPPESTRHLLFAVGAP